jgi:hypothetical protein
LGPSTHTDSQERVPTNDSQPVGALAALGQQRQRQVRCRQRGAFETRRSRRRRDHRGDARIGVHMTRLVAEAPGNDPTRHPALENTERMAIEPRDQASTVLEVSIQVVVAMSTEMRGRPGPPARLSAVDTGLML